MTKTRFLAGFFVTVFRVLKSRVCCLGRSGKLAVLFALME